MGKTWPIASDVIVETKHWRGRMVVEDVVEDEKAATVTYTMRSLDGPPPLAFGLFHGGNINDLAFPPPQPDAQDD